MTDFADLGIRADTRDLRTAQDELRGLTRVGAETESRVGNSMSMLAGHWRSMARAAGAALGALAAGFGLRAIVNESEQYALQLARIEAIIGATGGVAGRTTAQLEAQAQALARASLESVDGVLSAQRVLLTFRNVQGEVFDRAIESAADLAAAMGGDIVSATRQIARALEDPINGVTALARSGTVFTQQQRDMIRAMVEAGDVAGAQAAILAELEGQYGGAARAVPALSSALDSLGQSMGNLRRAIAESTGMSQAFAFVVDRVSMAVQALADSMGDLRGFIIAAAGGLTLYFLPALYSATAATFAWIAALITLRGALIATGIGALIVGAGMLINYLLRLAENTGSLANAFTLLGEVASEVWSGIAQSASALPPALASTWASIQAGFFEMVRNLQWRWADFLGSMARGLEGIPGFGSVVNSLDAAMSRANQAGFASSEAAEQARTRAAEQSAAASELVAAGMGRAREATRRLMDAIQGMGEFAPEAVGDVSSAVEGLNSALEATGGTAGGARAAVDEMADSVGNLAQAAQQVESAFESAFTGFLTGTKSAQDALAGLARDLARMAAQAAFRQLFGGGGGGGFLQAIGAFFGGGGGSKLRSYEGGGFTGMGPRTGGLDGRGGMLAMVHPNETVVDHTRGGGAQQIVVRLELSGDIDARIAQGAQGVAVEVVRAYDRNVMPGRVRGAVRDPRAT